MTVPRLDIARFSATAGDPGFDERRLDRMMRQVAARRLGDALSGLPAADGDWCITRLDVPVLLDPAGPEPAVETRWAATLADALRRALDEGRPGVVHYRTRAAALTDMIGSMAAGHTERAWAWLRLGLLENADAGHRPGAAIVAALSRHPEHALAALVAAAGVVGVPALDRALGSDRWAAVGHIVAKAAGGSVTTGADATGAAAIGAVAHEAPVGADGGDEAVGVTATDATATDPTAPNPTAPNPTAPNPTAPDPTAPNPTAPDPTAPDPTAPDHTAPDQTAARAVFARVDALLAGSRLAEHLRRSRLRPHPATARAWALLVAAEADPAVLRGDRAAAVLDALAARLGAVAAATDTTALGPGAASSRTAGADAGRPPRQAAPDHAVPPAPAGHGIAPSRHPVDTSDPPGPVPAAGRAATETARAEATPSPRDPDRLGPPVDHIASGAQGRDPTVGQETQWAGLAFLIATAAEAGVPDDVVDDPVLSARPLRWVLRELGMILVPLRADDPVLLAFAGSGARSAPHDDAVPTGAERARLDALAGSWAAATAARLVAEDVADPHETVRRLARRWGAVVAEPGWVEVHLHLDEVDVAVRRAGLDLDPGWVPWLGTVVRFRYA